MKYSALHHKRIFVACLVLLMAWSLDAGARNLGLPDFTALVDKSSSAVVNISTTQKIARGRPNLPHGMPGTPFDEFFKRFFGEEYGDIEQFDETSLGSGFIVSEDGYVLTNHHVIQDADEIVVRLSDRREFVAEVVGSDKRSDVALLKIDAESLPTVKIGQSGNLKVGSWVLAIGSPFGFDHTVTAGIVSAIGRSLPNENYVPFIQTDVAINPGNSGGPLFNMDGEVIGINSQIYSRTGGFMGLSFAIPIDMAMNIVSQLRDRGHVVRGWLGILIQDVTRELAESFNMSKPAGALVAKVLENSPAEKAGIKVGDIIVSYDGREVESSATLPPMVGSTTVGSEVGLKAIREGKPITLKVVISELPEEEDLQLTGTEDNHNVTVSRLNIVVSDLSEEQKKQLEGRTGIYIESVSSGAGAHGGLRRGDVLLMIDNTAVADVRQFATLVKDLPSGKSVPVLIQRRGSPIFLAIKIVDE